MKIDITKLTDKTWAIRAQKASKGGYISPKASQQLLERLLNIPDENS